MSTDITLYVVTQPDGGLITLTLSKSRRDAVAMVEFLRAKKWPEIRKAGYRVMKITGTMEVVK